MAVIQQKRLEQLLTALGLSRDLLSQQANDPGALEQLLDRQARLDRLNHTIDQMEIALGAQIGWPRVIVERDDQSLCFVSGPSDIEALRAERQLSSEDALWLKRQLLRQQRRWSRATRRSGLLALRRRERHLAIEQDRAIKRYVRRTGPKAEAPLPRLVVLIATLEPGWQAGALITIARQFKRLVDPQ